MSLFPKGFTVFIYNRILELTGLIMLGFTMIMGLSLISYDPMDPSFNVALDSAYSNYFGAFGAYFSDIIMQYFGMFMLMPIITIASWSIKIMGKKEINDKFIKLIASFFAGILMPTGIALLYLSYAGIVKFFGVVPFFVFNIIKNLIPLSPYQNIFLQAVGYLLIITSTSMFIFALSISKEKLKTFVGYVFNIFKSIALSIVSLTRKLFEGASSIIFSSKEIELYSQIKEKAKDEREKKKRVMPLSPNKKSANKNIDDTEGSSNAMDAYMLPDTDLLSAPSEFLKKATMSKTEIEQKTLELSQVLEDFGVQGEITSVRPGPVVTLYEFVPAPGIKSSRVISLADDIARSMSAVSARVAVIPGKNALGIELPNQKKQTVFLKNVLNDQNYHSSRAALPLTLGQDIGGESVIADLAKMPHLLMAGTTGSGKSVAVNSMILSLLYKLRPDECKFIMVDPKMLELSIYDGIPHLLTPVVTDPHKAVVALKWAVREMENRYRAMSQMGVRNIDGYNAKVNSALQSGKPMTRTVQTGFDPETGKPIFERQELKLEPFPYIVIIVDEMADLMLVAGKDVEAAIQRLAQMARAAGIHLIMATQRPSVDVITGTIKANFPTRISFQVTSKIDSRTILGESGAEQLLGQGDMLYMAGGGRMTRVHGPFVKDEEVQAVVDFLKTQGEPEYIDTVLDDSSDPSLLEIAGAVSSDFAGGAGSGSSGDAFEDLVTKAIDIVRRDRKASISYIQRQLKIGYNKSANVVEELEKRGVVTAPNHVGKREVLIPPIE